MDNLVQRHKIALPEDAEFEARFEPDLLSGVVTIQTNSLCLYDDWNEVLYRDTPTVNSPFTIKSIPYYAWDNRGLS